MSKNQLKIIVIVNTTIAGISLLSLVLSLYLFTNRMNIAYVENNRVFSEYQGVKENTREYEMKVSNWQANLDTLEAEINQDLAYYKSEFEQMSEQEKESRKEIIQKKQQNYFGYKEAIEKKTQEEDQRLTGEVLAQIDSYLLEYGERSNYDFIIGITDAGNLLYAKNYANITDEVIGELNQKYSGK